MKKVNNLQVFSGSQIEGCPYHARKWGFIAISDLEKKLQMVWEDIESQYGALAKDVPCSSDLKNPEVPVFTHKQGFDVVSAGWVKKILSAIEHGVHHVDIVEWEDDQDVEIPSNCWNSYTKKDLILLAMAVDANNQPVEWPVKVLVYGRNKVFETVEGFEDAVREGLELFADYGVSAINLETGEVYEKDSKEWSMPRHPIIWKNIARIEW